MNTMDKLRGNCSPEIKVSDDLGDNLMAQYRQMIGILQWSVEMRRIDLNTEVSLLSLFRVIPYEEHLETAHGIFIYGGKSVYQHHSGRVTVPELVVINHYIIIMTTCVFSIGKLATLELTYINDIIIGSDKLIKICNKLQMLYYIVV